MISLRVENLLLNNIIKDYSSNSFKEGSIFKGQVLEIIDNLILIDIKGQGVIEATSDIDIKSLVGSEISFLVKSKEEGTMELKPLIKEALDSNVAIKQNKSIMKILNSFNIKTTEETIDLVENLMKYDVALNEKNIVESVKILEKLIELTSLEEDEKVVLFENENITNEKTMENIDKDKVKSEKTNVEVEESISKEISLPEKINIRNLLVVDKNDYPEKEDISSLVKEFLGKDVKLEGEELNKILSFFIKNEVKPSLNNIKNFKNLVEDPFEFSKDIVKLRELLNDFKDKGSFNKLKDFSIKFPINKENIEESSGNLKEIQKTIEESQTKSFLCSNIKKEINNIENKLDFLKEMDQDLSFLLLPLNYGKKDLDGVLTLIKEKRNKKTLEDKINIFINLDTNNLGNIKISCESKLDSLSIKINIKEKDIKLFQASEEVLINRIQSMGFAIDNIDFIIDKDISIMDTIISNPNPTYFLDIKV